MKRYKLAADLGQCVELFTLLETRGMTHAELDTLADAIKYAATHLADKTPRPTRKEVKAEARAVARRLNAEATRLSRNPFTRDTYITRLRSDDSPQGYALELETTGGELGNTAIGRAYHGYSDRPTAADMLRAIAEHTVQQADNLPSWWPDRRMKESTSAISLAWGTLVERVPAKVAPRITDKMVATVATVLLGRDVTEDAVRKTLRRKR